MLKITGDATTQVITISDGDGGAVAMYPSTAPHVIAQLMQAAVMLGLDLDFPAKPPVGPLNFKKGN